MKSWKTTLTGVLTILVAGGTAVKLLLTGGQPDWTATIAAIIAGFGLIAARDNSVTSEQAGAK
jgi:putative flippase GtrA